MMSVLGFIGGAFDPIHRGHCHLAARALADLPVAKVWLIVNGHPPHRAAPAAGYAHRLKMARLAAAAIPGVSAPDFESPRAAPRYTIETARRLRRRGYLPLLIIGADAFNALPEWREWRELFALINFAVAARRGAQPARRLGIGRRAVKPADLADGVGRVYFWDCASPRASAVSIRRARRAGRDIADKTPAAVAAYIVAQGLYAAA